MLNRFWSTRPLLIDFPLLLLRAATGLLLLTHGWPKLTGFEDRVNTFADPFGFGSAVSLGLAVFAEFFCSILLILGLFTRLALIPLLILMSTIVFIIHAVDPLGKKESAILYLIIFLVLFFTGPGKYSLDSLLRKK